MNTKQSTKIRFSTIAFALVAATIVFDPSFAASGGRGSSGAGSSGAGTGAGGGSSAGPGGGHGDGSSGGAAALVLASPVAGSDRWPPRRVSLPVPNAIVHSPCPRRYWYDDDGQAWRACQTWN